MGLIYRKDFSTGWDPGADSINGPANALLRMDNCILDEQGVVAVRQGSAKINSAAFADTDVHSLYTAFISGTKYRMAGAGDNVYVNGTSLGTTFAGSGQDISFGAWLGQIFMARSTTTRKYDGTNNYQWGITAPAAPTATVSAGASKTFATWASGEAGSFTTEEGTQSFVADRAGTANAATKLLVDATTFRGSRTKTFASPQDFSVLSGSYAAQDTDIVSSDVYVDDPTTIQSVTINIDVNDGTFLDYYTYTWQGDNQITVQLPSDNAFDSSFTQVQSDGSSQPLDSADLRDAQARQLSQPNFTTVAVFQPSKQGWNFTSVARGQFGRIGSTSGKDWSTVKAVRVIVQGTASTSFISFDTTQAVGGLTGKYVYRNMYVNEGATYTAKSPVSAASATVELTNQGGAVSWAASSDPQVTHVWTFRMGGTLDGFYRVARTAVGTTSITDVLSDASALLTNIPLQVDNTAPPSGIIGMDGPYQQRWMVLTANYVYPSRQLDPDSYAAGQAIRIGDGTITAYWIKRALGGVYIGTNRDIYRLEGTLAELPDGTIDARITNINIAHPPVSNAVAVEGNYIVYLADDGWRLFTGQDSQRLAGVTDLLWRGYTRHGISAINTSFAPSNSDATARFRAAITHGMLTAMTPENGNTASTYIMYRYVFSAQRWYRFIYPALWRCIHREPDGTLIASDSSGFVWTLDTGTADGGATIPITIWTKSDDNGVITQKRAQDLRITLDSGGVSMGVAMLLDDSTLQAANLNPSSSGAGWNDYSLTTLPEFIRYQLQITGNVNTFRLYDYRIRVVDTPSKINVYDTGEINLGGDNIFWVRWVRIKANTPSAITVQPYFDDRPFTTYTATPLIGQTNIYDVYFSREYKGNQPRFVLSVPTGKEMQVYWLDMYYRGSGNVTQKKHFRVTA